MNEVHELSKGLADRMLRDAEDLVAKAQVALDQTKALVEIINNQVAAQAKNNADMVGRFKEAGELMASAHRVLDHGADATSYTAPVTPHRVVERQQAPVSDLARRGSFAGAGAGTLGKLPGQIGTLDPDLTRDPKRDPDANYPARTSGLPRPLADLERFRVNRADSGTDHHYPVSTGPAGG